MWVFIGWNQSATPKLPVWLKLLQMTNYLTQITSLHALFLASGPIASPTQWTVLTTIVDLATPIVSWSNNQHCQLKLTHVDIKYARRKTPFQLYSTLLMQRSGMAIYVLFDNTNDTCFMDDYVRVCFWKIVLSLIHVFTHQYLTFSLFKYYYN